MGASPLQVRFSHTLKAGPRIRGGLIRNSTRLRSRGGSLPPRSGISLTKQEGGDDQDGAPREHPAERAFFLAGVPQELKFWNGLLRCVPRESAGRVPRALRSCLRAGRAPSAARSGRASSPGARRLRYPWQGHSWLLRPVLVWPGTLLRGSRPGNSPGGA